MREIVETKEEKNITIQNDAHGGSLFTASHNLSDKHITLKIKNGSEPVSIIPVTEDGMDKLVKWLMKVANEIQKL